MGRVVWDGVLATDVPDDWEIRDLGDLIEILPPDVSGAVHLSIYRRDPDENVLEGTAARWVERVAAGRGVDLAQVEERQTEKFREAFASFRAPEQELPWWDVGVRVWDDRAVLFTFSRDESGTEAREQALAVFRELSPA